MLDLPFDSDTEALVLSALLQFADEVFDDVRATLPDPVAFYDLRHRLIYRAMLVQSDRGEFIDAPAVRARLQAMPRERGGAEDLLEEAGGAGYPFELSMLAQSCGNTVYHAQRLADLCVKRRLVGGSYCGSAVASAVL